MASVEELHRSSTLYRSLSPASMSRWGREGIVSTERDGFLVRDGAALERLAEA